MVECWTEDGGVNRSGFSRHTVCVLEQDTLYSALIVNGSAQVKSQHD